jgi:hypothetical protein
MMFSYSGPAQLVYADGDMVELDRVDLIESVTGGCWQLSGAGTAAGAVNAGEARIKLVTGAEADVLIANVRVSTGARGLSSSVTILASEAPPDSPRAG